MPLKKETFFFSTLEKQNKMKTLWRGLGHETISSQLICLSQKERAGRHTAQGQDCAVDVLSFKIVPCFVRIGIVVETEDVLGSTHWTLPADLIDDFGQNSLCAT